jgi:O6-methylguanine-DNA--protein-cysteine methyltransferase
LEGKDDAEKEQKVQAIIEQISGLEKNTKVAKTIESTIQNKEALVVFQSALNDPSGDFTKVNEVLIKHEEAEKRKQEEQQKQQETKEKTKSHSDTDRAYDFHTQVQNNFSKIPTGETITTYMDNTLFKIRKDTNEGQSTVLWNGMEISGVDMSDTKSMKENINQAMDSMRFLKENGLQVFGESIPKIIDAVNNRPERNGKERINLSDGINPEEQKELLETIGQMLDIGTSHKGLDTLKKDFHVTSLQSGGLLGRLQKKGYAKNDVIDVFAITERIKQNV